MDYTIKLGGSAGQGIQTIGETLAKIFIRAGRHVFTFQDYESRIKGGHNFYQLRVSENPIRAGRTPVNILVALDKASISEHADDVVDGGHIVFDPDMLKESHDGKKFMAVPFEKIAKEEGGAIMANTVAIGAVLGMIGLDLDLLDPLITSAFKKKGEEVIDQNRKAARRGFDHAREYCTDCSYMVSKQGKGKYLINGNEALGIGVVAAGVKFYSAYPMTPSTGVMTAVAGLAKSKGIVVEQAEDELSAINMALGASFGGVRAMTGTSGGGFALMSEGFSLAGMTETPIVVALVMRPGPATGFPTRTEQGDLAFALTAGHGEFPRIILAPGTPEECFLLGAKAFELTEKYQVPVIVLSDQYLADSQWSYDEFPTGVSFNDYRIRGSKVPDGYKRHAYTGSGVTPLAVPGTTNNVVFTDSDEHDEAGHIVEDAETRLKMTDKRLFLKMDAITEEMPQPELFGDEDADTIIVCWGSMQGVAREAAESMESPAAVMHFSHVYPLPADNAWLDRLRSAKKVFGVEQNATGQFARLITTETGFTGIETVLKYDGRPFTADELTEELNGRS